MSSDANTGDQGIDDASTTIVRTVSSLVDLMGRGGISELDVDYLDVRIRLRGHNGMSGDPASVAAIPATVTSQATPAPAPAAGRVVKAPMVGTFYVSSSPNDAPFVQVGDTVRAGQVIGIIEAMKIMNEIPSDLDGVVAEILADNGQPVEYGSDLIRVVPPGAA